jgi:hypothetical protein
VRAADAALLEGDVHRARRLLAALTEALGAALDAAVKSTGP